ncbi:CsoS2 family carboxysome shell protein, partial [Arthrospira platensis SPKY1]|nr:CsoS2 family carboxysome shell protein [Arthrospira platensis SPKY1]
LAETLAEMAPVAEGCGCGCNGNAGGCSSDASPRMAAASRKAMGAPPSGRDLARARRDALARDGKSGLLRVAQATRIAATMPTSDWQSALQKGASGRQLAMQRRLVQSLTGRAVQDTASQVRPTGRVRTRPT